MIIDDNNFRSLYFTYEIAFIIGIFYIYQSKCARCISAKCQVIFLVSVDILLLAKLEARSCSYLF